MTCSRLGWTVVAFTVAIASPQPAAAEDSGQVNPPASQPPDIVVLRDRLAALDAERAQIVAALAEAERRNPPAPSAPAPPAPDSVGVLSDDFQYLETLVVAATRSQESLADVPTAVTVVGKSTIQEMQRGNNLEESLKGVPGVLLRDQLGGSSRVTISIRGAGATTSDGARGIRLFVDGIPKNNAGGSAQDFINIDLSAAENIEVVRGPSSALYGNQAGGVVSIISESGGPRPSFDLSQVFGSYGFSRTHAKGGGQSRDGTFNYFGTAFKTALDGFRVNSNHDNAGFTTRVGMTIDAQSSVTAVLGYDNLTQRAPGALTAAEMLSNPRQANPVAVTLGGNSSSLDEFRFGAIYRRQVAGAQLEATGYYTPRGIAYLYNETRRTNQIFVNRGASARVVQPALFGTPVRLTAGLDYQNTPITTGNFGRANTNLAGQTLSELEETASTIGPYVLADVALGDRVSASVGARYDRIAFTAENLVRPADGKGEIVYEQFSPRIGLTVRAADALALYANYNEGFEAPILGELRNSPARDGEFVANQTVKPFDVRSIEVGARGQIGRRVTLEAALYRQRTNNLIVSQSFLRLPPLTGQFNAFVNAGKVDQNGVEFGATVRPHATLTLTTAYTFTDYTYRQFESAGIVYSGRTVPGVPSHNVHASATYRPGRGWSIAGDAQRVGRFFLNDLNTASNEAYLLANVRVGYEISLGRGFRLSPWVSGLNLRNRVYAAQTQPNAAAGRYFNPLPGRTFLAGLRFGY
jgi:iron complex outermembrane receptor protein